MQRTDATDGGCGGGLDFAQMASQLTEGHVGHNSSIMNELRLCNETVTSENIRVQEEE